MAESGTHRFIPSAKRAVPPPETSHPTLWPYSSYLPLELHSLAPNFTRSVAIAFVLIANTVVSDTPIFSAT
jgi:hypothetical protein